MPPPLPLSVVVITKNEERRLADCLESVRWAAETIVVDDFSTDRTVEIARRYTDRVIQRAMDVEGRHRNAAYELANYEWILSIDADERVTPELHEEIAAVLAAHPPLNGYTIPRRNYLGRHWLKRGGFYPSAQLRLFRKGHFRYEEAEVHPRAFLDTETGRLTHDLMHYSYRNLEDFVAKLNRQTTLETRKWVRDHRAMPVGKGLWRAIDRFGRTYWGKRAREDGLLGFIVSILAGLYQFLSFAKYWFARQSSPSASACQAERSARYVREGVAEPLPPGPRQTITAVILTKNEAARIRSCLDTIRWVDEIVVVDGESTDGTPEICQRDGAKVISHRFGGDFGEERNLGNAHATSDWVLQLDADDLVTPAFRAAAERILRHGSPHAAYRFRRTNCFLGRWMSHGGWDHYSLHFFRRGKARYQGRVHHALLVDGSTGTLNAPIEHYPFDTLEQFLDRQNRYTTLEARELLELHGPASPATFRRQVMIRPVKLFWKYYVKKRGCLDGMHGFLFSGLFSFVHFLKWAKYWELCDARAASEPQPAVFLDRDGVINASPGNGFVTSWAEFSFLPGSQSAIRDLRQAGYHTMVVSNQSGVGLGMYSQEALQELTRRMLAEIRRAGGELDGIFYCLHAPADGCGCRKPGRGLVDQACRTLPIDLSRSFVIGDDAKDISLGRATGCRTILVLSGKTSSASLTQLPDQPDHVCRDLRAAADWILTQAS